MIQFTLPLPPTDEQNALLLKQTESRLKQILRGEKLDKAEEGLLKTAVDQLSTEGLLNEQDLLLNSRDQLLKLVKDVVIQNDELSTEVEKLVNLLSSEIHKSEKSRTVPHVRQPRKEVGIPERLVRFQRFNPK